MGYVREKGWGMLRERDRGILRERYDVKNEVKEEKLNKVKVE